MMIKQLLGATCVLLLLGCQVTSDLSDEALITELLDTYKESLLTRDVDRNVSLFSEHFAFSGQVVSEQDLRLLWDSGRLDVLDIAIDLSKIAINNDGTASVPGVKVIAPDGNSTRTYTLAKTAGSWSIAAIELTDVPTPLTESLPEHSITFPVSFRITDAITGDAAFSRVHISDANGVYWPARGHQKNIGTGWREDVGGDVLINDKTWAYVTPEFVAELPAGRFTIEVMHGMEYLPAQETFAVNGSGNTISVSLRRWASMNSEGWYSGDNHTHFLSDQSALLESRGEGLNVINILATKWGELITNVENFIGSSSLYSTDEHIVYVNEETRHNHMGHTILHPLKELVYPLTWGGPSEGVSGAFDYPPMAHQADKAHEQGALVTWAHFNLYGANAEAVIDIALGKIDSIDLMTWGDAFQDVLGGTTPGPVSSWYALLNTGASLPATAGTDKMSNTQVSGSVRTYVYLGADQLSYENWVKGIKSGNTFVTTGPMIWLTADGEPIGSTLKRATGDQVKLEARVLSPNPVRELEIIQDGKVVGKVSNENGDSELTLTLTVEPADSTWIAARAYAPELLDYQKSPSLGADGVPLMAHTSPIYVDLDDKPRESSKDATMLLTFCEQAIKWVKSTARFQSEEHRTEMLALYEKARDYYQKQLSND